MNNSSVNYLNRTNSNFLKDKLNKNSGILTSKQSQISIFSNIVGSSNNQSVNSSTKHVNFKIDNNRASNRVYKNSDKNSNNINDNKIINNENEPIQDTILNKSNKSYILLIKVYLGIIYILLLGIIIYSIFKFINTVIFHNNYENLFYAFNLITNKYLLLNYYFNTFKSLIIFPIDQQKKSLNNFLAHFEELSDKYGTVLNKQLKNLNEIKELYEILKDTKHNSTELIYNNNICNNSEICIRYLFSPHNIMDVGIDFLIKSLLIDISKIYLDYMSLNDKYNMTVIQEHIITPHFV
jgi:hypothetical protein